MSENFNPFNPETEIPFELNQDSEVSLIIYDTARNLVRHLDLGFQPAGLIYRKTEPSIGMAGRSPENRRLVVPTSIF